MKKNLFLVMMIVLSGTVGAQTETKADKTIDSVKAVQAQEQRSGTITPKVIDGDALPLQKEQNKVIYDNNRIDDHHNSVNGNSTDINDKKVGGSTTRYPSGSGAVVAPTATSINRDTTPTRSEVNTQTLDSAAARNASKNESVVPKSNSKYVPVKKIVPNRSVPKSSSGKTKSSTTSTGLK